MTVFVLVITLFLSGGDVAARAAAVKEATLEDCKSAGAIVIAQKQGQRIATADGTMVTVLDAQFTCVPVAKLEHA
jgi:hypothetical protein